MFLKVIVKMSFFEAELGKPFTEGEVAEMPPNKAKEYQQIGWVDTVGTPVGPETAELPQAGIEKAVKRSRKRS